MFSRSEVPVLSGWIEKLPEQILRGRPWVDVYRSYTLALSGRPDDADPLLEEVEKRIEPGAPSAAKLSGHIVAIRAYAANLRGDAARVMKVFRCKRRFARLLRTKVAVGFPLGRGASRACVVGASRPNARKSAT